MIYYFSGTGNTEHVAKKISTVTDEGIIEITHNTSLQKGKPTIIATPIYFWLLPQIVEEFIAKVNWKKGDELIFIVTCGGFLGTGDLAIEKLTKPAQTKVYQLPMETNYIILHDVDEREKVTQKLKEADTLLLDIIEDFDEGRLVYSSNPLLRPGLFLAKLLYNHYRQTKKFQVTDACNGCGICEKNCPDFAIKISPSNGKPLWIKESCQNCLKCLHFCPKEAIEYGNRTKGKKRYTYKKYKPDHIAL